MVRLSELGAPSTTPHARPHVISGPRTSKTSLGMISTPLIWPVRKKPETITRPPERPVIYLTKPPAPQTTAVTNTSQRSKVATTLSVARKTILMSKNTINPEVALPWQQMDLQNKSEGVESFQVAALSNRKNKPLAPHWAPTADAKNGTVNWTEPLDYPSGIDPFIYDIDLGDEPFSLYDFESPYSLDESLGTALHGSSRSTPSVATENPGPGTGPAQRGEHLHNQSDTLTPRASLAEAPEPTVVSSWTPVRPFSRVPGETGVQTDLPEPDRISRQTPVTSIRVHLHHVPPLLEPLLPPTGARPPGSVLPGPPALSDDVQPHSEAEAVPTISTEERLSDQTTAFSQHFERPHSPLKTYASSAVTETASSFSPIFSVGADAELLNDATHAPFPQTEKPRPGSSEAILMPAMEFQRTPHLQAIHSDKLGEPSVSHHRQQATSVAADEFVYPSEIRHVSSLINTSPAISEPDVSSVSGYSDGFSHEPQPHADGNGSALTASCAAFGSVTHASTHDSLSELRSSMTFRSRATVSGSSESSSFDRAMTRPPRSEEEKLFTHPTPPLRATSFLGAESAAGAGSDAVRPTEPMAAFLQTSALSSGQPQPTHPAGAEQDLSWTMGPLQTEHMTTPAQPQLFLDEGLFYRVSFIIKDTLAREAEVERTVTLWLNQTFQNWTYTVYVIDVSVQLANSDSQSGQSSSQRYTCQALLMYKYTTDVLLQETAIKNRLTNQTIGNGLVLDNVDVQPVENCVAEESPLHYNWPESRPTVTQFVPCFPNKAQNASRTCSLNLQNYTSFWESPDFGNCTDIDGIEVSAENAADVATQLADITQNELSTNEVSKVVTKLKEIVNVAKINASLATTMVTIFSNVMTSSDTALAGTSELALKTVDEMVLKIVFEGPSLSITSKNLALGISAFNSSDFNGTSFSAFMAPNTTDLQIDFESEQQDPLAAVTLPATLLSNLSYTEAELISRINFMFFSKIGLFQDDKPSGLNLSSYVVASSVGNQSIKNLRDPVKIEIVHLQYQPAPRPVCVFWDFSIKNGTGGWSKEGCTVSPNSNGNKTICLCDHLTHFGILMDISGSAAKIDAQNTKILTFITYIGCGISAIFSAATLLTYIAFEKLRRDYPSKILMNLSTSLLFLNMVFLLDGWLASFDKQGLCIAVAVFLHFFLLTSFTWMGLESIHMYIALVKVFNTYIRRYILKFCIVGWGLPAAIVAIVVAVDRNSYGKEYYGKEENGQGSSEFCWIKSHVVFYVTCVGYFCIIFLMNVAMFIVVMIQICGRNGKRSNRTLREEMLRNLRSVVSLTFLLGMTWGFAFFAWGPVNLAFMYLFSIFNSLQGLFIFIFHCALKENVQKQWRRYLCCGRFRLADNSDWSKTATNNTKKVSSDNLGKSLSSSSFGSSTANWTSKAKATLNPFAKRGSNAGKGYSSQSSPKFGPSDGDASSSIIPVHQVIDKVKGYCLVRSDNFYKNIIMSDSFSHSTKF
ncbi:hypothetical protein MATL_G00204350 [Megalops atlanticus]|uniref:Adhesion G-protein coupled receptor G6 n=1 Tax=Megalops atlanticus TaxID=7932 RepID=A0A9D3T4C6_MEGAT|nr:hypothetical protein MATL_G00204350 [Megalops atlanticus]